ncbi:MAG TPA: GNAT family N-acetyltransferase [Acidimicrobiales bacterium]|nr:GNAT family N-acetyltransferase [Acidimicrobiales bacterium]
MAGHVVIEAVEPSRTYVLRQQVLRPNLTVEQMAEVGVFGDDGPDTGIYGAIDTASGELVGTGNVRREPPPSELEAAVPEAGTDPWRLRGMATREDLRSHGIGKQVLDACIGHVAARGGGFLWCNARVGARRFYARAGFSEWGDEFESFGVQHVVMWRLVEPEGSTP